MPPRTNAFQDLVALIQRAITGMGVTVTSPAMLRELDSKVEREVDVLIRGRMAGFSTSFAMECRDHKEPQDMTWIDQLVGKYGRLVQVDKIIAVSSSGFTKGARTKAKYENIETLTLKEAQGLNWPDYLARFKTITMEHCALGLKRVKVVIGLPASGEKPPLPIPLSCRVVNTKNEVIGGLQDWVQNQFNSPSLGDEVRRRMPETSRQINFEGRSSYKDSPFSIRLPDGRQLKLLELVFAGRCQKLTTVLTLHQLLYGTKPVARGQTTEFGHKFDIVVAPVDEGKKQLRIAIQIKKQDTDREERILSGIEYLAKRRETKKEQN
jgi:hypothetical protein